MIEYRIRDTSTMLKLFYVIFMNLHRAPYMIPRMRAEADHPQRYTEEQRYSLVQHAIYLMNKTGKINTVETGAENLPKQGGYMMYPNHQGKYDVLGIMYTHKSPCSFVMDKRKSHTILVREFCDLVQAKRLEKDNPRQGITIINQVAKEVAAGKKYILFPEGGYRFNNKNKVCDFKAGSFKIALKSHAPIVPIALIDSYKVFNSFHIGPITTYVHYLKPICYEEYKGMKTQEIADLVKIRIEEKIQQEMQAQSQTRQQQSGETQKKKPELANWQKVMDNGEYLRSAEMAEEANYNMIDGLMNNTPKKKDKNKPRESVLARLRLNQKKVAKQGKKQTQQKAMTEDMERKKK